MENAPEHGHSWKYGHTQSQSPLWIKTHTLQQLSKLYDSTAKWANMRSLSPLQLADIFHKPRQEFILKEPYQYRRSFIGTILSNTLNLNTIFLAKLSLDTCLASVLLYQPCTVSPKGSFNTNTTIMLYEIWHILLPSQPLLLVRKSVWL